MPSSTTTKKTTRSGNPARRAEAEERAGAPSSKYTPSAWGNGGSSVLHDLTCPSGQVCQVRRPGLEGLMKEGILHNLDVLTPLISQHREKAKGKKPKTTDVDVSSILKDPEQMSAVLHLLDRVLIACVVQPPIEMAPNDPTSRELGVVYTDMVDTEDKMFILNYTVGGSSDLERFRDESARAVGGVLPGEADEDQAV